MSIVELCTNFSLTIYKLNLAPDYTKQRGSRFYQELRDYWVATVTGDKVYVQVGN